MDRALGKQFWNKSTSNGKPLKWLKYVGYPPEPQDIPKHPDTQILQPSAGQKPWSLKLNLEPQS